MGSFRGIDRGQLEPGASYRIISPPPSSQEWTFTQNPGTYELKFRVILHPHYEEEDKDNNLFILTVEVKE